MNAENDEHGGDMVMHNDIEGEETTLRVKITTVLLLAWSIVSLAVIANFTWSYVISKEQSSHVAVDDARVARMSAIQDATCARLDKIEGTSGEILRNQQVIMRALKVGDR